ncbi:hypothetical protein KJS94_16460 [Flavihumibacter rivuli]|uniref:hypothetical protein n=1 Tax=Flavihumibacter rivuli TaxID=2838156 RepID=UPI001BDF08CF|nr:hypothetical protein [Flavihumibacter rivuli]ULQ56244.1 hypothetical protein KJS94_16460 [Flavihumibacter rivuli]
MKKLLLLLSLAPFGLAAQNKDWKELQSKLDSAAKVNGTVYIERNYTIDKPLIVHNWNGSEYKQVSIKIIGNATYSDNERVSQIRATFKDAPILSIQKGVGCIIRGINFRGAYTPPALSTADFYKSDFDKYGDPSCRDSWFSPYAALCLDPFTSAPPADGGYPGLKEWYRGPKTRGGCTGIRVEDCTFGNVTIGVIVSPNGYTQNGEMLEFRNIRFKNCKAGFVGCQGQERLNQISNVMAWENIHTVFVFNKYGASQPGHYIINGVNIAGSVVNIIHRYSGGFAPLYMSNVYAESILSIGLWDGNSGDVLSNSLIHFRYPEELGFLPDFQLKSFGLKINNCTIRYLGRLSMPLLMYFTETNQGSFYVPNINNRYGWDTTNMKGFRIHTPFPQDTRKVENHKIQLKINHKPFIGTVEKGDFIVFMAVDDWDYRGQGMVTEVNGPNVTVDYISPSIKDLSKYRIGVYKMNKKEKK